MRNKAARSIYREREMDQGKHLKNALLGRYQRRFSRPKAEIRKLGRSAKGAMSAHNPHSRAYWFTLLAQELARHLEGDPSCVKIRRPLWFVTLIDRRQSIDPDRDDLDPGEREYVHKRTQDFLRNRLGIDKYKKNTAWSQIRDDYARCLDGFEHIGMLDAGLYVSARRVFHADRIISVHAHVLVWNASEADIAALRKRVRQHMRPLLDHATSIVADLINPIDFLQMAWYIAKTPRKQYQAYLKPTGRYKQYRGAINGVNSVRLYAAMAGVTLDQLTFARGGGTQVLSRMHKRLARLRRTKPVRN